MSEHATQHTSTESLPQTAQDAAPTTEAARAAEGVAQDGQLDDAAIESVAGGHIGEDTSLGHDIGTILAAPFVAGYKLAKWIDQNT